MKSELNHLPKRKSIRLKHYDYSTDGYYFVTICAHQSRRVIDRYGDAIKYVLYDLPNRFAGVSIDYHVLMPSHMHIIFIFQKAKVPLWEVVRAFKAVVSRRIGQKNFWQRGYYEHVIRSEKALLKIRAYILNNPLAERIKFEQFY
jgi:REP element-mobilizing transposase RayT